MTEFFSKEHTILEQRFMEYRPFGVNEQGQKIQDISGVIVKAVVNYLEEAMSRLEGPEGGEHAVQELCRKLNERIRDPVYHVTPAFLKNVWNSYSYEFVCYLREFGEFLSGDPEFQFHVGREKNVPPTLQILGRPFSVAQIYKMWPHFGQKYVKGCLEFGVGEITDRSAVLRMKYTDKAYQQFGAYRKACAELGCQTAKGGLSAVPERVHRLQPAAIKELACIVNGDEWCEWQLTWSQPLRSRLFWPVGAMAAGGAGFAYLLASHAEVSTLEALGIALAPAVVAWLTTSWQFNKAGRTLQDLIWEQDQVVEARHEELREAYLEQEKTTVELRRTVNQLTTLHRAGLLFSSTFDRETLLKTVLETMVRDLQYDQAFIAFYDHHRQMYYDLRSWGGSEEIAAFTRSQEAPVSDPHSIEGTVLLEGRPVLVGDIRVVWDRLHPVTQHLASLVHAKSLVSVPLKVKDRILGSLTVNRTREHAVSQDDVNVMVTLANQVAIALDNTDAYHQIELLNVGLEARVRERTTQLETANDQLKEANEQLTEMDRLKSEFVAHVSHELRTPLTSICGFTDNILEGLAGPLTAKQEQNLTRVKANVVRLTRMIAQLLEQTRMEAGKIDLLLQEVPLIGLAGEVVEQLRPIARTKHQRLILAEAPEDLRVWGDTDRLTQILTNLVDNALKYTPEGGSVTVRLARAGPHFAKVSVTDTGVGIPADEVPQLFDRFFRSRRHRQGHIKGLGLGLAIVKHLVELHGGVIAVKSQEGKGTEVRFTLPLRQTLERKDASPTATKRILVVDDDADIRELLRDRLTSDGYLVSTGVDGRAALELLRKTPFDGLILDINMPHVDGLEVLHWIRECQPTMPVIMITAAEARERAVLAMEAGAQAYLLKPFDSKQLRDVVNCWF